MPACRSRENAGLTKRSRWALSSGAPVLALLASACSAQLTPGVRATPQKMLTASEALAVQSRVTDCEWKAADRYDDGRRPISELADQVMGLCAVELVKAAMAFGFSPNDPQVQSDQLRQAIENVEAARRARAKRR